MRFLTLLISSKAIFSFSLVKSKIETKSQKGDLLICINSGKAYECC